MCVNPFCDIQIQLFVLFQLNKVLFLLLIAHCVFTLPRLEKQQYKYYNITTILKSIAGNVFGSCADLSFTYIPSTILKTMQMHQRLANKD